MDTYADDTRIYLMSELCMAISVLLFMTQSRKGQVSRPTFWLMRLCAWLFASLAVWELADYPAESIMT
eukprot:g15678.t1